MKTSFTVWGHPNILGTHRNTLEFTKDEEVSPEGDCIIGVKADFYLDNVLELVSEGDKVKVVLRVDDLVEEFEAVLNKEFSDGHEMVFRVTDFSSKRTFGMRSTKGASQISREMMEKMKDPEQCMSVELTSFEDLRG